MADSASLNPHSKPDGSPITDADLAAHRELVERLPKILTLPVISEEGVLPFEQRRQVRSFWLVDPVDNTKELIAGEYRKSSVAVALVLNGELSLSAISYLGGGPQLLADPHKVILATSPDDTKELASEAWSIQTQPRPRYVSYAPQLARMEPWTEMIFRSAGVSDEQLQFAPSLRERFFSLLLGAAEVYLEPRRLPAWDVAPFMRALLTQGATILSLDQGEPLSFNTEDMTVKPFVVARAGIPALVLHQQVKELFKPIV